MRRQILVIYQLAESAYVLRRVELNGRISTEGQSPWSIRQTAVYHKLNFNPNFSKESLYEPKSTFLLIALSKNAERRLSEFLELSISNRCALSPCNIQRLLVADSLGGWADYMAWLETQLKEQVRSKPSRLNSASLGPVN
jgi:hypothetical protein